MPKLTSKALHKQLAALRAQEQRLLAEVEKARLTEAREVISQIRVLVSKHDLTMEDIFGKGRRGVGAALKQASATPRAGKAVSAKKVRAGAKVRRGSLAGVTLAPKYRDENGNTWAGRGQQPVWLREALNAGRSLESFAVDQTPSKKLPRGTKQAKSAAQKAPVGKKAAAKKPVASAKKTAAAKKTRGRAAAAQADAAPAAAAKKASRKVAARKNSPAKKAGAKRGSAAAKSSPASAPVTAQATSV